MSKGSYHSKILSVMATCKLQIHVNVNLPQLFYCLVSAALNGEFEHWRAFALTVVTHSKRRTSVDSSFSPRNLNRPASK